MRKHIGLIIAVVTVVAIAVILLGGRLFGEKPPEVTYAPLETHAPVTDATFEAPEESHYEVEFHPGTTTTELAPTLPDKLLPNFTDMEETSPISFGKDKVGGRRVIVYSEADDDYTETYMTYVNGGVWSITMRCSYREKDVSREKFQVYLNNWSIPVDY